MAVAIAGSGNVVLSGGAWAANNTAITVTGAANSILLVWMFAVGGTSAVTWDAAGHRPTWNGTALTKLLSGTSTVFSNFLSVELYYMVAPAAGSFNLTTFVAANTFNTWAVWGQASGAAQAAPTAFTTSINQANNNAATSGTLTPATALGMMFSAVLQQGSTAVAVNLPAGHTLLQNTGAGNVPGGVGRVSYTSSAAITMTWSHTGANTEWTNLLVAVEEFAASAPTAPWMPEYPDIVTSARRPQYGLGAALAPNLAFVQPIAQFAPVYAAAIVDASVPRHPTTHVSEQWYAPMRSMKPERKLVFSGAVFPDSASRRLTPVYEQPFITTVPPRPEQRTTFFDAEYADTVRRPLFPASEQWSFDFRRQDDFNPPFNDAIYDDVVPRHPATRAEQQWSFVSPGFFPSFNAPFNDAVYDDSVPRHAATRAEEQWSAALVVVPTPPPPFNDAVYDDSVPRLREGVRTGTATFTYPWTTPPVAPLGVAAFCDAATPRHPATPVSEQFVFTLGVNPTTFAPPFFGSYSGDLPRMRQFHPSEQWYAPIRSMQLERRTVFFDAEYPDTADRRRMPVYEQPYITWAPPRPEQKRVYAEAIYPARVARPVARPDNPALSESLRPLAFVLPPFVATYAPDRALPPSLRAVESSTKPVLTEPPPVTQVFFFQPCYQSTLERVRLLHLESTFNTFSTELLPLPNPPPSVVVLRLAIEALRPTHVTPFLLATSRATVRTDFPLRVKTRIV